MNQIKKTELNEPQQKLIELMQQINFGRISNIPVVDGNPELTADTIIEREIKLGGQNGNRPELDKDDFTLKQEVLALIEHLTGTGRKQRKELIQQAERRRFAFSATCRADKHTVRFGSATPTTASALRPACCRSV